MTRRDLVAECGRQPLPQAPKKTGLIGFSCREVQRLVRNLATRQCPLDAILDVAWERLRQHEFVKDHRVLNFVAHVRHCSTTIGCTLRQKQHRWGG
jgi:hypothetical protein